VNGAQVGMSRLHLMGGLWPDITILAGWGSCRRPPRGRPFIWPVNIGSSRFELNAE